MADRLLFGEALSVLHYNAVSQCLCHLTGFYLRTCPVGYFDDFTCPAWEKDHPMASDILEFLRDVLGTRFNPEKAEEGPSLLYLGLVVAVDLTKVTVTVTVDPRPLRQ